MESWAAFSRVRCGGGKEGGENHTKSRTHLLGPHEREKHTHAHTHFMHTDSLHPNSKRGRSYSPDSKSHTNTQLMLTSGTTKSRSPLALCNWPVGFSHCGQAGQTGKTLTFHNTQTHTLEF